MATLRPPVALRPVDPRTSMGTQLLQGSPVDRSRLSSPPSHHFRGCCRVAAARHHRWVQKNQCKSIRLWSPTADWAQSAAAPTPKSRTVSSNLRANKCVAERRRRNHAGNLAPVSGGLLPTSPASRPLGGGVGRHHARKRTLTSAKPAES